MIKGSEVRKVDYPIDNLFLDRWSPGAMTGDAIPREDLMVLFEAARWAPSSFNNQPWRMLYATRDSKHWQLFFDLLVESNQVWAKNAAVLILFISKTTFDYNGKPSVPHTFDTGAAWAKFALQGWLKGFVVHGMQGFDYDRARRDLNVPDEYKVEAMVGVGILAAADVLPEKLQKAEAPSDRRKLDQTICEGPFLFPGEHDASRFS